LIVIVMGVAGAGKTTVGSRLAAALGCEFIDADDYHAASSVAKMRAGEPLADDDRWPWLARLNGMLQERAQRDADVVLACSALKASYRERLARGLADPQLVYLRGSPALIAARLARRGSHFMNPALLDSQFATLEEPRGAIVVEVDATPEALVGEIRTRLASKHADASGDGR
jgi:gluconokinase